MRGSSDSIGMASNISERLLQNTFKKSALPPKLTTRIARITSLPHFTARPSLVNDLLIYDIRMVNEEFEVNIIEIRFGFDDIQQFECQLFHLFCVFFFQFFTIFSGKIGNNESVEKRKKEKDKKYP